MNELPLLVAFFRFLTCTRIGQTKGVEDQNRAGDEQFIKEKIVCSGTSLLI